MADLSLNGLTKIYPGGTTAVQGVSAEIADGEFIVLVGPSGCGKSTVLRMIAGLETISEGELRIGGEPVNHLEPGERDIAMVFQNYALYPHMSVRRNMEYGLRNEGVPRAEIDARIAEAARTLQLDDYMDRKPRQLSGGQRQRVAMGRAIVRQPRLFLFDEPLSNLDAKLRVHMRAEIKALHRRLAATFVYVTHDQIEAMSLANRIIVMNGGRVEQTGRPLEVYQRPQTRFVANFIGTPPMNVLEGEVGPDQRTLRSGGHDVITLAQALPAAAGARVALGVRPECLRQARPDEALFAMEITLIEELGSDSLVHGRLANADASVIVRTANAHGMAIGATHNFRCAPEELHLFDMDTGVRLA